MLKCKVKYYNAIIIKYNTYTIYIYYIYTIYIYYICTLYIYISYIYTIYILYIYYIFNNNTPPSPRRRETRAHLDGFFIISPQPALPADHARRFRDEATCQKSDSP